MAVHDSRTLQRWRAIFAEQRRSGLTIVDFCQARMINKSGFFRWRNILEQFDHARVKPDLKPSFVPLRVVPEAVAIVEVILPTGIQLRVPLGADASQVARLALALGATPC
jgi:hypothetical protein